MKNISPLFNVTNTTNPESIRVSFPNTTMPEQAVNQDQTAPMVLSGVAGPRLTEIVSTGPYKVLQIASIDEAEDYLMAIADQIQVVGDAAELVNAVGGACTTIAMRTRRALGNTVLLHPDRWAEIVSLGNCHALDQFDCKSYGRWTLVGQLHSGIDAFVSEKMDRNGCYVFYTDRNSTVLDGPAILYENSGMMQLMMLDNLSVSLGNAAEYILKILITE